MAESRAVKRAMGIWRNRWLAHSARTAVGAAGAFAVARWVGMPEAYWAPVSTLIVMQSTLGASWAVSRSRFLGTALGAGLGGLVASFLQPGIFVFAAAVLVLGLACALLRLDRSAYRFAGVALAIVMLVARQQSPPIVAVHRFVEVSIGIGVALLLTALWPESTAEPDGRGAVEAQPPAA